MLRDPLFIRMDLISCCNLMINADQRISSANRELGKYSVRQLESMPLTHFASDDRKEKIRQLIEAAFRESQKSKIILPLEDTQNNPAFFDLTFIPPDQKGSHAFILVSAENVILRELLKKEISLSLTQYESFMKHTRRPIALIDRKRNRKVILSWKVYPTRPRSGMVGRKWKRLCKEYLWCETSLNITF